MVILGRGHGEADAVLSPFRFGRLMENGSAVHTAIAVAASVFFLAEAGGALSTADDGQWPDLTIYEQGDRPTQTTGLKLIGNVAPFSHFILIVQSNCIYPVTQSVKQAFLSNSRIYGTPCRS